MTEKRKHVIKNVLYWFVRIQSIAIAVFAIIGLARGNFDTRPVSSYVSILLNAVVMILISLVPLLLYKLFKLKIPVLIEIFFIIFSALCIMFGEIFGFYAKYSWWDDVLHVIGGSIVALFGYIVLFFLNEKETVKMKMSPVFISIFLFCFSMAGECLWEIFEFTTDKLTGSNMQRYMEYYTKIPYVGQAALADTMGDMIEGVIGALIVCALVCIDMYRSKKKSTNDKIENKNEY